MSKFYNIITVLLVVALLLCGCASSGGPGNGTDPSNPTASTPAPTDGTTDTPPWTHTPTEPQAPTTDPTPPPTETNPVEPTQPTTEPPTEPTLPWGYISEGEAITAAAEYFRLTDYRAECSLEKVFVYVDKTRYVEYYFVTLDDGKYIYEATLSHGGLLTIGYCTPKEGTIYPGGPDLPPLDMSDEDFKTQYTIHYPAGKNVYPAGWPDGTKRVKIRLCAVSGMPAPDSITIYIPDGRPVFQYKGRIYIWESDTVFTEIGLYQILHDGTVTYTLYDGEYEFLLNHECEFVQVSYGLRNSWSGKTSFFYPYEASSYRLEISDYDHAGVKCFGKNEDGEVEFAPEE